MSITATRSLMLTSQTTASLLAADRTLDFVVHHGPELLESMISIDLIDPNETVIVDPDGTFSGGLVCGHVVLDAGVAILEAGTVARNAFPYITSYSNNTLALWERPELPTMAPAPCDMSDQLGFGQRWAAGSFAYKVITVTSASAAAHR